MLVTFTFVPSVRAGDTFQMSDIILESKIPIVTWFKLPCLTSDIKPGVVFGLYATPSDTFRQLESRSTIVLAVAENSHCQVVNVM